MNYKKFSKTFVYHHSNGETPQMIVDEHKINEIKYITHAYLNYINNTKITIARDGLEKDPKWLELFNL